MRFAARSFGRISKGIDMSFRYGLTSGEMLQYIYANKPNGNFIIGKMIDKYYLENQGWKAIRQRKSNLKSFLKDVIERRRQKGDPVIILDVASGPAGYLIETMMELGENGMRVICSDLDVRWLAKGKESALNKGLKNITFIEGNAFSREHLKRIKPAPNVVVSSGFYDWILSDKSVKHSLNLIYELLPENGEIVFTNQCGHLQMEMVSEVFLDFNRKPLRMKIRSPEKINSWAEKAGFKNITYTMDSLNLYSVSRGCK